MSFDRMSLSTPKNEYSNRVFKAVEDSKEALSFLSRHCFLFIRSQQELLMLKKVSNQLFVIEETDKEENYNGALFLNGNIIKHTDEKSYEVKYGTLGTSSPPGLRTFIITEDVPKEIAAEDLEMSRGVQKMWNAGLLDVRFVSDLLGLKTDAVDYQNTFLRINKYSPLEEGEGDVGGVYSDKIELTEESEEKEATAAAAAERLCAHADFNSFTIVTESDLKGGARLEVFSHASQRFEAICIPKGAACVLIGSLMKQLLQQQKLPVSEHRVVDARSGISGGRVSANFSVTLSASQQSTSDVDASPCPLQQAVLSGCAVADVLLHWRLLQAVIDGPQQLPSPLPLSLETSEGGIGSTFTKSIG